jgi:hypothetical protein
VQYSGKSIEGQEWACARLGARLVGLTGWLGGDLNLQVSPETKDACDLFRILLDKRRLQYDSRGAHCISNIIIITIIVIIINTRAKAMVVAINHDDRRGMWAVPRG